MTKVLDSRKEDNNSKRSVGNKIMTRLGKVFGLATMCLRVVNGMVVRMESRSVKPFACFHKQEDSLMSPCVFVFN